MNPALIALMAVNPGAAAILAASDYQSSLYKPKKTLMSYDSPKPCPETKFVVVVEIDNVRAAAAFKRGLDELETIWPAIEAYCAPKDEESNHKRDADLARYEAEYAKWDEEQERKKEARQAKRADYLRRLKEWEEATFFRGDRPNDPERYEIDLSMPPHYPYLSNFSYLGEYEKKLNNVRRLYKLASAATAPYKVKEEVALQMVGWEDGSTIAEIKQTIGAP